MSKSGQNGINGMEVYIVQSMDNWRPAEDVDPGGLFGGHGHHGGAERGLARATEHQVLALGRAHREVHTLAGR